MNTLTVVLMLTVSSSERWQSRAYEQGKALAVVEEMRAAGDLSVDELSLLAYLQQCLGRFDQSIETLRAALKAQPEDAQFLTRIAHCHWFAGRYTQADRVFARLQRQLRDSGDAAALAQIVQARAALQDRQQESLALRSSLARIRTGFVVSVIVSLFLVLLATRYLLRP